MRTIKCLFAEPPPPAAAATLPPAPPPSQPTAATPAAAATASPAPPATPALDPSTAPLRRVLLLWGNRAGNKKTMPKSQTYAKIP